jgi:probable ATP-dependent RNA helicase DDX4
MPKSVDEYVHRIGRTGRMGNTGRATSFYDSGDNGSISKDLVKILKDAGQEVPEWMQTEASRNLGSTSGGGSAGGYGGRDIRTNKSGASSVFAPPSAPLEEEEMWD